jgi:stage II sporulation protein D
MRRAFLLFVLIAFLPLPLMAGTLRIRLWWQHPPAQLRLAGNAVVEWRSCATCRPHVLHSSDIKAEGRQLRIAGKSVNLVLLRGSFDLTVEGSTVHLAWPVEIRAAEGRLRITVTLPLEEYVAAVLAGEAGGITQDEALKAMAVAARTYAVHFRGQHASEGFDFCDTTHCQDLRLSATTQRARQAALETEGELLWFHGETAATYYHRSCGGTTEDGIALQPPHSPRLPYLRSQMDPYCVRVGKGTDEWRGEILKRDLVQAMRQAGLPTPPDLRMVTITSRTASGRAESLRLEGTQPATMPAAAFRLAVGRALGWQLIRSDAYQVTDAGDRLVFFGHGQGHGVGLCQTGAAEMASEGHNYRDILGFYFPGTRLGINAQGLNWTMLSDDHIEILTTAPDQDRQWIEPVLRAIHKVEQRTGWTMPQKPQLRMFPTVAIFRDSTGEPGWVAASTRGRVVRLQPARKLAADGILEGTLTHEFAHFMVEARAHPGLPLWFREGLVMWIAEERRPAPVSTLTLDQAESSLHEPASQQQLRQAYAAAYARVNRLVEQYGAVTVLSWVESGLPKL